MGFSASRTPSLVIIGSGSPAWGLIVGLQGESALAFLLTRRGLPSKGAAALPRLDGVMERHPGEEGALDPDGELFHALERVEVSHVHPLGDSRIVHHPLDGPHELFHFGD